MSENNDQAGYRHRATQLEVMHIRQTLGTPRLSSENKQTLVATLAHHYNLHPAYVARIATGLAHQQGPTSQQKRTPRRRLPKNRKNLRNILGALQDWRCRYCLKNIANHSTLDHIVPLAKGGKRTRDNLQLTCRRCNNAKGTRTDHQFRTATNRQQKFDHTLKTKGANTPGLTPFRFLHCSCTIHGCYPACTGCELCAHYPWDTPVRPACPTGPDPPYPCPTPSNCQSAKRCTAANTLHGDQHQ